MEENSSIIIYKKLNVQVVKCTNCGNTGQKLLRGPYTFSLPGKFKQEGMHRDNLLVCTVCYPDWKLPDWRDMHMAVSPKKHVTIEDTKETRLVAVEVKLDLNKSINNLVHAAMSNTSKKATNPSGTAIVRKSWKIPAGTKATKINQRIEIVEDI